MNGSKFVPSIKNIVREICISSCEGKYPYRDNAKLFFLKSQRARLRVQWKQCKLNECKRIFPGTCKPEISDEMDRIVELLNVRTECRYRYAEKKFILCVSKMQIALVSIQRKIKFNVGPCDFAPTHFNFVPSFPGYEIAQLLNFFNAFRLFLV